MTDASNRFLHDRRAKMLALSVFERARNAGIPPRYMRIVKEHVKPILKDERIVEKIYIRPLSFKQTPFIIIDGGSGHERKLIGYALLFRFIACSMSGQYRDFSELSQVFTRFKFSRDEVGREEVAKELKQMGALFISEFRPVLKDYSDAGVYFDEIFEYRGNYQKPTILSFNVPLSEEQLNDAVTYGRHFCAFSKCDEISDTERELQQIYRIKL